MKILWLCNIMLPVVAEHLKQTPSNKEGWLTGLSSRILQDAQENQIELGVCFPTGENLAYFGQKIAVQLPADAQGRRKTARISAYGFREDVMDAEHYDAKLEERFREIVAAFEPDVVHCFGTEYPHTLAMVRAFGRPERTLIGIQGLCTVYARHYRADLPDRVWKHTSFRDLVKRDSLQQQQIKYVLRGKYEVDAIREVGHVTGRTDWDRKYTHEWNPKAAYHFMNETLRSNFYDGKWEPAHCEKHTIFLSQGDYPIKGLHYMLRAMPEILRNYPDASIAVAGNSIIKTALEPGMDGIKGRLKLESYGQYILELIKQTGMTGKVRFLGRCTAQQMKEQYLKANVFVCPSSIENSPNCVGEAMLIGVPTVCANVGGISSIFQNEQDGLLYPAGNVEALAAAVCRMFSDENFVGRATIAARVHARMTHNPEKNYLRLMDIYSTIMEASKEDRR